MRTSAFLAALILAFVAGPGVGGGAAQSPPRAHVGAFEFGTFALPTDYKPRRLEPYKDASFYGLRWWSWGTDEARGTGKARVNDCSPSCAEGHIIRRRGARATLYRLRAGTCDGEPARFYTRASLRFPRGLGLHPRTVRVRLDASCAA